MLAQAPRTSLADTAADSIRAEISAGRWAVGSRIPIEPQLAQLLGVSRGTVREAVKTLVSRGLLEVRQGSGTYVRSGFDPSSSLQKMRLASLRDQFEVRQALEVEAARLAAVRHTARDLRRLHTLLDRRGVPDEADNGAAFIERDLAFHLAIVDVSGNLALAETCRFVTGYIKETIASSMTGNTLPEPDEAAHRAIVEGIASRNPETAAAAVRAFMAPMISALALGT
ncbi:FadR/GntR family transcriptional regulator [Variovorax sp. NFACC27]|uniref:FadR family transcriptional regulator n=1 Tax=Variovorax gossypii TaxID=1679495 RepID=A0A3S0JX81_9BURK|nr:MULTISPECIES: FadR/GntR family transcriptional regulator [Variovorax]MDP9602303.1 DNA-binding FadR family transcriptional regulator [Variovorax paradoxus]SEF31153.1 transcriptional regulator, GntR family [Variovorax sp. NFACC28]SEG90125.1 transcriptional regulator, GntR family [Variovorax sp. NFACC29]SFD37620.1 transcriptional regulator, GntR family [Variovorax sp. NFACC26]SFG40652.1 transcriptional regulator, GntR family [Variovorax sp. NFACC27]